MIDITEIKKMQKPQKLELINLLWESLEEDGGTMLMEKNKELIIPERINAEDAGLITFDTWENVRGRLIHNLDVKGKKG